MIDFARSIMRIFCLTSRSSIFYWYLVWGGGRSSHKLIGIRTRSWKAVSGYREHLCSLPNVLLEDAKDFHITLRYFDANKDLNMTKIL